MNDTTYARRKAQGICPVCQHPPSPGHVYCDACIAEHNAYSRTYYDNSLTPEQRTLRHIRQQMQAYRDQERAERAMMDSNRRRYGMADPLDTTTNLVAHCGGWHAVPSLPYILPCCGLRLALESEAPTARTSGRTPACASHHTATGGAA